jgi:RNA polymerase sigma-70 factor (ECF subfamily)
MSGHAVPIEALLAHRAWVRGLARSLVHDESRADDLEQQAWLAALEGPPAREESARAWFATVLRRAAARAFRGERRRDARERSTARPEAVSAGTDLAAHAEIIERVVRAVLDLEEPYRSTVLLRYFEGLEAADIARRTGTPLETVRSRLRRALERLRERLDDEHGRNRKAWVALVLPLALSTDGRGVSAGPGLVATGTAAGGFLMAGKALVAGAAVLMLAVGGWWMVARQAGPTGEGGATKILSGATPPGETVAKSATVAGTPPAPAPSAGTVEVVLRGVAADPARAFPVSILPPEALPGDRSTAGQDLSLTRLSAPPAAPVATLEARPGTPASRDGIPPGGYVLRVGARDAVLAWSDPFEVEAGRTVRVSVTLATVRPFAVSVFRADGAPAAGETVILVRRTQELRRRVSADARSDGRGTASFAAAPAGDCALLWRTASGAVLPVRDDLRVPEDSGLSFTLPLIRPLDLEVVDEAGHPVAGARVEVMVCPPCQHA